MDIVSFLNITIQGLTNKRDLYCAAHFLYILHMTKVLGRDFISAVLNVFYIKHSLNIEKHYGK